MGTQLLPLLILMFASFSCNNNPQDNNQFMKSRQEMVNSQIKARGISDQRVLDAMLKVERHLFISNEYWGEAYDDHPLPIGYGQTISQPYIVAFMTDVLKLKSSDRVLEIGTGSGYQAAILAEICDTVFTIEIVTELAKSAETTLAQLGYKNVYVRSGDGYKGWQEKAPFNAIIVTCAPTHIPQPLQDQLTEGGRMIIPVGGVYTQELILLEKREGVLKQKDVLPVRFVPMINPKGDKY